MRSHCSLSAPVMWLLLALEAGLWGVWVMAWAGHTEQRGGGNVFDYRRKRVCWGPHSKDTTHNRKRERGG